MSVAETLETFVCLHQSFYLGRFGPYLNSKQSALTTRKLWLFLVITACIMIIITENAEHFIQNTVTGYYKNEKSDYPIVLEDHHVQAFVNEPRTMFLVCSKKNESELILSNELGNKFTSTDSKLQTSLDSLSNCLLTFSKEHSSGKSSSKQILSLDDEVRHWRRQSHKNQSNIPDKQRSDLFVKLLQSAAQECSKLESAYEFVKNTERDTLKSRPHDETIDYGSSLVKLLEVLDSTVIDALDEVWRCLDAAVVNPYPENRMRALFEAMSFWIVRMLQNLLSNCQQVSVPRKTFLSNLWMNPFNEVQRGLQVAIRVCNQWQKSSTLLTQHVWCRYTPHAWEGQPPDLNYMNQFKSRLDEVLTWRALYEQLQRILPDSERAELGMTDGVHGFLFGQVIYDAHTDNCPTVPVALKEAADPLAFSPWSGTEKWAIGMSLIASRLQPAEERAATKIRSLLSVGNSGDASSDMIHRSQLTRQFQKYQDLIQRPLVSNALQAERETLLGYLEAALNEFREEFARGSGMSTAHGCTPSSSPVGMLTVRNIPETVNRILWAAQLESRIQQDVQLMDKLLSDLERYNRSKQDAQTLLTEMVSWRRELFENWSRDSLARLNNPQQSDPENVDSLSLDPNGRLLRLRSSDGRLEVGFPDGLVQLQREVRLLSSLGYPVPSKLVHAADQAQAFYRYAIVLKQVAHFYNSIDSQMLPSQQALMLNSAMQFERLIKTPKSKQGAANKGASGNREANQITWDQTKEMETYIGELQNASRQLMTENRKLRKVHFIIVEKIIRLLDIDLLRNQTKWRNEMADIRYVLVDVANHGGYPADHMVPWRAHLDRQLYKALEHQYRYGLEWIHERMLEIRADMVYHQSRLAFKPPFEEIKAKYYREMRKFICIPNHFRGVSEAGPTGDGSEENRTDELIFPDILVNQTANLRACYRKAEFLFTRLLASVEQFKDWVVLGNTNLDELVDSHCRELADFERNFKALKTRGRDAEKLPNEIRIDCVTVNCLPVKTAIEGLLQNLFEALQTCLRRSIHGDLVAADAFLTDALEKLSRRPQTVDELSEAKAQEAEFVRSRSRLTEQLTCAEAKDRLLRGVAGAGVQALGLTKAKWDKFQLMMESFRLIMTEQLEIMKGSVESRTKTFKSTLDKFTSRWKQFKPGHELLDNGDHAACRAAVQMIGEKMTEFKEIEATRDSLIRDHKHFTMDIPNFTLADEISTELGETEKMWNEYQMFLDGLEELAQEDWVSFKSKCYLFDEFLSTWFNKLRSNEVTPVRVRLQREVDQYRELVPTLKWLRGDPLSPDHWLDLFRLIGLPRGTKLDRLKFMDLLGVSKNIISQSEALKTLNQRAQAELVVREALQELDTWGVGATFTLTEYIDTAGQVIYLVKDWKDIVSQVGDNLALLTSLQDSPFFDSFADRANAWAQRLADLDHCLTGLQAVQRRWVYLEPILGRGALPKEMARFAQVDGEFRRLLAAIKADNRVVSLVTGTRGTVLREQLASMQDQLSRCQRALNEYLEEKRSIFPRFYFLGDDDLLEILGQSTNPSVIQSHLRKLFQGIHHVEFGDETKNVTVASDVKLLKAICSLDGEVVPLQRPVQLTTDVEVWLGRLATEMKSSLSDILNHCLGESSSGNQRRGRLDPSLYPGQILALSEAINFARNVEDALNSGRLSAVKQELQTQLAAYTSVDLNNLRAIESSTSGASQEPRKSNESSSTGVRVLASKLSALVLDTVHAIDVVDQLINSGAATSRDWVWQKQLRFYATNPVVTTPEATAEVNNNRARDPRLEPCVSMVDATFAYTFEYQGNTPRLVHTPLTDRCYLTLTQAMRMGLGGNPYGPAGTGKTESVKALGCLMGRQVLVFNCDEGIDVLSMGRILVGIVKCGAWGCFDEFNRLEESVLSAVSMQIQVIQDGLQSGSTSITLLNRTIGLDMNSGLFITLNPAGKGYGGRQKLPDNLKQLFRPIAMTKPDVDLIAEMILFSNGFRNAQLLGRKLVSVFALARQLLSVQQHYDWGLRALKTVLHGAGTLLQVRLRQTDQPPRSKSDDVAPLSCVGFTEESRLIIRAARTNTLAKLTSADAERFEALLHDVFPDPRLHSDGTEEADAEDLDRTRLTEALHQVAQEYRMVLIDTQIRKALEVYEQAEQRMGVVLVGPSGCGKSTVLRLLRLALARLGRPIRYHVFNPKAMLRVQLLGHIDPDTREWTDGVLTHSARCVVKEDADQRCWIVCDGDIDPEWVESLNSVLDDNRLLTLPSGERIQFGPNVNFLFETHELTQASPATVSRMGVVYVSEESMESRALVGAWLAQQPEEDQGSLDALLNPAFYTCLDWVQQRNDFVVETSPAATVFNGLSHLVGATTTARLTVGLIRGLGANLPDSARKALALQVYAVTGESPPDSTRPLDVQVDCACPTRLVPYAPGTSVVLLPVSNQLIGTTTVIPSSTEFSSTHLATDADLARSAADCLAAGTPPLILTPDVRRAIDAFRCWLEEPRARQSFLLVGPEGCGKSRLLDYCFTNASRPVQVATVQCSAQTTPAQLLEKLSQCCITVTGSSSGAGGTASGAGPSTTTAAGRVLRPREGDRLILYLRDLNLPKPDKWGSCQLTAFLQQILTYHGYYDPTTLEFVGIEGIQFVGSFTPADSSAGLGRHHLSPRFTSALRLTVIGYPDREQLISIYTCLLQAVILTHVTKQSSDSPSTQTTTTKHGHLPTTKPSRSGVGQSDLSNPVRLHSMASLMVQLLATVQQHFRADEHAHCVFTPHLLTDWVGGLARYELAGSVRALWAAFGQEARRLLRDRLPGEAARAQFDTLLTGLVYNSISGGSDLDPRGRSENIPVVLKLATKEVDGDATVDDFDMDSSSDREVEMDVVSVDELLLDNKPGCFVTWGAKEQVPASSPMPLHGRPLGYMSLKHVAEVATKGLTQLSRDQCPRASNLVLFPEFVDLICRVDRALSRPAGSLLLAGRAGIGRRSIVTLVAHLHQLTVCQLRVGRDYTMRQFCVDVKGACQLAGIEARPTLLLVEDHQFTQPAMLEMLNSLLACGEASGLFTAEELETATSTTDNGSVISVREAAAEAGHRGPLSTFVANRIRVNLHVVIVLDVDDTEQFTRRIRSNPSLYKHCSIQWLDQWTQASLTRLPKLLIPSLRVHKASVSQFCQAFVKIHQTAPHQHMATPRRYLALCAAYARIEQVRRQRLEVQAGRLQAGLAKLDEARGRVSELKKSATEQGAQLAEKQAAADQALEQISSAMQGAAEQRTEMEALRNRVASESKNLERRKAAIDQELAEIEPLVQQARAAVGSIRPEALSEIRALRAPPDVIRDILEGVLLLMGTRDTSWVSMRGFLAKRGVQDEILNFDARKITAEIRSSVERLLAKNQDSFDPKIARRASIAAAPLATWVRANVQYAIVLDRISPLENEQAKLRASLGEAESSLSRLTQDLAGVDVRVAKLRAVFERHTSEATRLKVELDRAKETLSTAETLVGELEGEHARWKRQVNELSSQLTALPPLSLLSAAFITYLSSSPEDVRQKTLIEWVQLLAVLQTRQSSAKGNLSLHIPDEFLAMPIIPTDSVTCSGEQSAAKVFEMRRFLTTEREQLIWHNQGLPSDRLSVENAVVILETGMCPFIVDPSSRALSWLKMNLQDKKVEVINQQSPNFTTTLELAVRFGKTLIIQEVDEIEPILIPILSGNLVFQGSRPAVPLGDKMVDFHPDFRLFLCTRQTSSQVGAVQPASAASLVTVINFVTTRAGLVGQLLATSLQHERPELEQRREELVRTDERMRVELSQLEDNLLEELANAHGNVLENKELLQSLNKTKQSSLKIADSLTESKRLQAELDKERDVFHPLAEAGGRVYFVLMDLVKINWMYQFSLNSFLHLFQKALEAPQDLSLETAERMTFLQKRLEALVYADVSQALFKSDRLMFTLFMARCLRPKAISEVEWQFFIGLGTVDSHPSDDDKNDDTAPHWLSSERVRDVKRLKAALPELYARMKLDDAHTWSVWMADQEIDTRWSEKSSSRGPDSPPSIAHLSSFQRDVLAVQALRPDRLHQAMHQFAIQCLDFPQLGSPTLNLHRIFQSDTRATEPILLLISPGADPSQELAEAAANRFSKKSTDSKDSTITACRYRQVAMGQGQSDLALKELREAVQVGDWLCLKNLHLVIHWLPTLEKEINHLLFTKSIASSENKNMGQENDLRVHEDFRLWLTAEPHVGFPSALLQNCRKVAYEAPPGLKRNLRRTYESWTRSYLSQGNSSLRATALATLAWFHAVVQERRSFIPQGWTKFYEFSYADLRTAADVIDRLLIPRGTRATVKDVWSWVHGLLGDAIYGGRMDNSSDWKVLQSYLKQMFSDETMRTLHLGPLSLPGSTEWKDYTTLIESLPDYDLPSYFNLPANIDKTVQYSTATRVRSQLRLLTRTVGKMSNFDKNVWSQELGPILTLWKKLNQGNQLLQSQSATVGTTSNRQTLNDRAKTLKSTNESNRPDTPVVAFLRLELQNALNLIHTVHTGLAGLSRACRGMQFVTAVLHRLAECLLVGETPQSWLTQWPEGPEEPATFLRDLVAKVVAVQNWLKLAEDNGLIHPQASPLDLAVLFRPTTFLNAVRQQTARQLSVAMDTLELQNYWPDEAKQGAQKARDGEIAVRINKLQLEGAQFEGGQLVPARMESPALTHMPEGTVIWRVNNDSDSNQLDGNISVPVYMDRTRCHLVTHLLIPCPMGSQRQWVQASVALFLTPL